MPQWLLNRLLESKGHPTPRFAFQGTVNWMKALSVLTSNGSCEDKKIKEHYSSVCRRKTNHQANTWVFESMLLAFHNQASLVRLTEDATHPYDMCRAAIISWYYATYFTCSAMNAAASGSNQKTHALTAKVWQSDIVVPKLVMSPFSLSIGNLVEKVVDADIATYRGSNEYDLNTYAKNDDEAWGAVFSYLKGTSDYEKWRIEEKIKTSREFKALGVDNFRTKVAKTLRDEHLSKSGVNYLTQAFRYRGKANYRDSIFLSYGADNSAKIKEFVQDLEKVSRAFQRMAAGYLSRRVENGTWCDFIADLEENSRLSIGAQHLVI